MTEILTESFCERCGTRYTFESSAPRRSRLGRVRTLSKGVRNFVMSDEASFSEAMADARGEEELAATAHQLDAFHKTFNFCLGCRQYTCGNCWNRTDGRCLSCAPAPGEESLAAAAASVELLPVPFEDNGHGTEAAPEAWPEADLTSARLARVLGEPGVEDDIVVASPAIPAVPAPEPEVAQAAAAIVAEQLATEHAPEARVAEPAAEPAIEPAAETEEAVPEAVMPAVEPERVISEPEVSPTAAVEVDEAAGEIQATPGFDAAGAAEFASLDDDDLDIVAPAALGLAAMAAGAGHVQAPTVQGMEHGQSLEEAVAAYEARLAFEEVRAAEPGPVVAEPEAVAVEPGPVVAEPEVEPAVAAPEPVGAVSEPVAAEAPALDDVVVQPTWPSASPAPIPADVAAPPAAPPAPPAPLAPAAPSALPWLSVAPDETAPSAEPQWPAAPVWPVLATRRDTPTTLAGRPLLPQADSSALWAASAREVMGIPTSGAPAPSPAPAAPTPQPCVQCGLSLSANARFCRRCGTRQG